MSTRLQFPNVVHGLDISQNGDFFNVLIEHSGAVIYLKDTSGHYQWVNDRFCAFVQLSREQILGKTDHELFVDSVCFIENDARVIQFATRIEFEEQIQTAAGQYYFNSIKFPIYNVQNQITGICAISQDISAHKATELALQQSESRFQQLFQKAPIAMGTDDGHRITQLNDQLHTLCGYSAEEIGTLDNWFETIYPDPEIRASNIQRWKNSVQTARNEQKLYISPVEYQLTCKDGSQRQVLISALTIGPENLAIFWDITDEKRIKAQLQASEERLSYALQGANDGLWDWNLETNTVYYSPRWFDMLGYGPDELPYTLDTWSNLVHPECREYTLNAVKHYLSGKSERFEVEFRLRHKQGHWIHILSRARLACNAAGEPITPRRLVGTHIDITSQKQAEEALKQSEAHYRKLFEASYDAMFILNPVTLHFIDCNPAGLSLFCVPEQATLNDLGMLDFSIPLQNEGLNAKELAISYVNDTLQKGYSYFEWLYQRHNGEQFHASVLFSRISIAGQIFIQATVRDVTEQQQAQAKLKLAASVFNHAREGIMITDAESTIIDVNDAFEHITGYSRTEVVGKTPSILSSGHHSKEFYADMYRTLEQYGHWNGEVWNRHRDGNLYVELLNISEIRDTHGQRTNYVGIFTDISLQKEHQKQLEHLAHYDSLTGLPNRVLLADRLQQAIAYTNRYDGVLAVTYIDLDGFKEINDRRGHEIGDQVLIKVAQALKDIFRESDTLARIGGDEFIAVLTDIQNKESCIHFLNKILEAIAQPFYVNDEAISLTASIGVSLYPQAQTLEADHLTRQADQAMYKAKLAGKNNYYIFDAEHDQKVRSRSENLQRLKQGLDHTEFRLYYQPKINLRTGKVFGAEALIRWQHPEQGFLLPAFFLPDIEDQALEKEVGEWVIETVLKQIDEWNAQGTRLQISVNIGAYQLQQLDFFNYIKSALAAHPGIQPNQLELEILETSALEDMRHVIELMNACHAIGVQFAIDDFGTGYSSLTYLKRLPSHMVKIDQTFIRDMFKDVEDLAIIKGVVDLATAFRRKVIAEGVESLAHASLLLQLGCDMGQGNGFAKPMPPEQLLDWIANWKPDPSWTQTPVVSREHLPLLFAKVAQDVWLDSTLLQLSKNPKSVIKEPPLHQWLTSEGEKLYGSTAWHQWLCGLLEQNQTQILALRGHRHRDSQLISKIRSQHKQLTDAVNQVLWSTSSLHI